MPSRLGTITSSTSSRRADSPWTGLIESALAPLAGQDAARLAQLKNDLSVVISAEALFTLLDLARLTPEEAVVSLVRTASSLTRDAVRDLSRGGTGPAGR